MRIIVKRTLIEFWNRQSQYNDSKKKLEAWYSEVKSAKWKNPADIKKIYGNASILKFNRVVFNICGNKYRLVVKINYLTQIVFIRFIGTHEQYDEINVEEV